ncbi:uncharacterized protein LOC120359411 [Solenopsis invicta]|uniref:uncharacterized protein LOC120359411 n=1 Tax=Solenopsis invicta TaxID=13686 RepID=UPI00193D92B5|nr:uncharacterized protein LOC120359411 [Solenopsis invicta]
MNIKENQFKNEAKIKEKTEDKILKENEELNNNFNFKNPDLQNFGGRGFQISPELPRDSKIQENGNHQTCLGLSSNLKILREREFPIPPKLSSDSQIQTEGSYQTSNGLSKNLKIISEGCFQTPPSEHFIPADREEGSYQTSSSDAVFILREPKEKSSSISQEKIKSLRNKTVIRNDDISHSITKIPSKENRTETPEISKLYYSKENESLAENVASTQQMSENFKSKQIQTEEEKRDLQNKIPRECFQISENLEQNRLAEIMELLRLDHLNIQDNVINLISGSQDRFHIPGEKLTATHVLQHQIPTTDDRPINTRQYRFPQIHKEEINKQVEELLEGGVVKLSQSPYNTPIWIVSRLVPLWGDDCDVTGAVPPLSYHGAQHHSRLPIVILLVDLSPPSPLPPQIAAHNSAIEPGVHIYGVIHDKLY